MAKIDEWLEYDKLVLLGGWARDGLTMEQIAHNIGISRKTLYEWQGKNSDIRDILKRNREVVDYEVENALYKNAMNGNVTAQIYWLKNRQKEKWRDVVQYENANTKNGVMEELVEALKNVKKD